jgi:glycosyltransferase involved in cell wall biosynthesis
MWKSLTEKSQAQKTDRRRVVFYADASAFGGAEHYLIQVASRINHDNFESHIVLTRRVGMEPLLAELSQRGTDHQLIDAASTRPLWRQFWNSFRYFRRIRPHVVHFNRNWDYGFVMPQLAARLSGAHTIVLVEQLAVGLEKKRSRHLGGLLPGLGIWRWRRIIKRRLSVFLADVVITPSNASKKVLCEDYGYPPRRVRVIPNGVEVKGVSREAQRSERPWLLGVADVDVLIGAVGRLSQQKGFQYLLPAFELVHRQCPQTKLCIVGEGELRAELERWIADRHMQDHVLLLGHRRDVDACLACFDVFAFPSLFEGMPFTLLEAMAAGLPIVATAIPPIEEAIDDGKEGLLVPAKNVEVLAETLLALIQNPPLRKYLGRQARKRVAEQYSLRACLEHTWQLYCVES